MTMEGITYEPVTKGHAKKGTLYLNFKLTFTYKFDGLLKAWYPRCILLWMAR